MHDNAKFREEVDSWEEVRTESFYPCRAPDIFGLSSSDDHLKKYFLRKISSDDVKVPAQDLYYLNDGFVSDLTFVFDRYEKMTTLSARDHVNLLELEQIKNMSNSEVQGIDSTCAFIFKAGKNNYGHFLLEMLPKIENILKSNEHCRFLIVPSLPPAIRIILDAVIDLLYRDRFELIHMSMPLLQAKRLIVPGPVTKHNDQKSQVVSEFADKILLAYGCSRELKERRLIYVSRSNEKNRQMTNEKILEYYLEEIGFEIVYPQNLKFEDQVRLFSTASHVVGPIGAALSNIIFCPKGAKVAMISPGMFDFFFYDIACLRNLDFTWLFTSSLKWPSLADLHGSWKIDVDSVKKNVEKFLE